MKRRAVSDGCSASPHGAPPAVILVLTTVCVLVGTPLAVSTWRQARADWQTVPTNGVVAGIQFVKYARPLPRARGPWHVVWEVECGASGAERVSVTALGSYRRAIDAEEASRGDLGRRVIVWHIPGSGGPGSLSPPDWERGLGAAVWTTVMAAYGWLGVAALQGERIKHSLPSRRR